MGGPIGRNTEDKLRKVTRSRNIIRGIDEKNPLRPIAHYLAQQFYPIGLYQDWDGVDPDPCSF